MNGKRMNAYGSKKKQSRKRAESGSVCSCSRSETHAEPEMCSTGSSGFHSVNVYEICDLP
jgi:hypothetical protein